LKHQRRESLKTYSERLHWVGHVTWTERQEKPTGFL